MDLMDLVVTMKKMFSPFFPALLCELRSVASSAKTARSAEAWARNEGPCEARVRAANVVVVAFSTSPVTCLVLLE